MLKILISYMLGPFGMQVQEWYIQHSLLVNSLVVLYGLLLVISHLNYKRVLDQVLANLTQAKNKKIDMVDQNLWMNSIQEGSFFPLVSGSLSLIPKRTDVAAMLSLSAKDKRWNQVIADLQAGGKKKSS